MKIFILIAIALVFYLLRANVMAAPILKIGDDAPTFTLPDSQGNQVSLSDYKSKWVVLYFYPKDDTPGCTKQACQFRDDFKTLEALGAKVIGVSIDDSFSHKKFAEKYNLPFTLLSDTDKKVIKDYGASSLLFTKRISYLIDKGVIIKVYPKVDPATHAMEILKEIGKMS